MDKGFSRDQFYRSSPSSTVEGGATWRATTPRDPDRARLALLCVV